MVANIKDTMYEKNGGHIALKMVANLGNIYHAYLKHINDFSQNTTN